MGDDRRVDFQHHIPLLGADDPGRCVTLTLPRDITDIEMYRVCAALRALVVEVGMVPLETIHPEGSYSHDD